MKLSKEAKSIFVSFKINKTYHYLQHFLVFEIFMVSNLFQKLYLHENLKVVKKIYSMKNFDFWKKISERSFQNEEKLQRVESRQHDEKLGKRWKSTSWWKVREVMKPENLMKSLENDESRQPDEKFGKWWKLTTWWKVRKVMKVNNLMSEHELFKKFRLDSKTAVNEKKEKHEKRNLLKI